MPYSALKPHISLHRAQVLYPHQASDRITASIVHPWYRGVVSHTPAIIEVCYWVCLDGIGSGVIEDLEDFVPHSAAGAESGGLV